MTRGDFWKGVAGWLRVEAAGRRALLLLATGLLVLAVAVAGCGSYRPANAPLERVDPAHGYRPDLQAARRGVGEVALILAFSGGGTRAASMSFGVLEALRDTQVAIGGEPVRLLDEVDLITSVSGGSFTSAYYGLFGDRIFEDYEEKFLKRNVQGQLLRQLLRPRNWFRLLSTFFDRSELAIQYYDSEIFEGATFADLEGRDAPLLHINATDLSIGARFTFFQPQFDLICSDLSRLSVARAVAASSAVPVLFSPITLRNYAGECGYQKPAWLEDALGNREESPRRFYYARDLASYLDASERRHVHLVDGGLSDNIGIRGPLDNVMLVGGIRQRLEGLGSRPRHLAVIIVNAQTDPDHGLDLSAASPSLAALIGSVSEVQIHRYNFETLDLLRRSLRDWERELAADGRGAMTTYVIELSFDAIRDADERRFFNNLATSFFLTDETVDRLRAVGGRLLRESSRFGRLLEVLGGEVE